MKHLTEGDLQAWIDEELDPADRVGMADHLADCAECRHDLEQLRAAGELFSGALSLHDDGITQPSYAPGRRRVAALPAWIGRAAAVTLLLGGAAAAAVVPGSPIRALFEDSGSSLAAESGVTAPALAETMPPGAGVSLSPADGRLAVRLSGFPAGTRIRVRLHDGPLAAASLPDTETGVRFVVASGLLEVVGPGPRTEPADGDGLILRIPARVVAARVEVNGEVAARVSNGRLVAERRIASTEDGEAVIVVGG